MESLRSRDSYGWPQRALWAAVPTALALGFLSGILIAVYRPGPPAGNQSASQPAASAQAGEAPRDRHPSPPDPQDRIQPQVPVSGGQPLPQESPRLPAPVPDAGPGSQAVTPPSPPANEGPLEMLDIADARTELVRSFSRYPGMSASIDYQQMRNAGMSTSVVGMLTVEAYDGWVKAAREEPARLSAWLESAAHMVLPAMQQEQFFLAWAVVDVLSARPAGFSDYEVTPLANGKVLVVRPLASTIDPSGSTISIRSLPDAGNQSGPTAGTGPWATYGPVLRFDATDLYRPLGAAGTRPR